MGFIQLLDSGYIKPNNAGSRASSSNMANTGSAMSIKAARFVPSLTRNISNQARLSSNKPSEINLGSLENMKFELRCVIDSNDATDQALVAELINTISTNGYKLLWYDYSDSTIENNNGQLIYRLAQNSLFGHQFTTGEQSFWGLNEQFYHIHVYFSNIQLTNENKGLFEYSLQGTILPVPTITNTPS